ncbi:NUDIX domain-containing protein [Paenibacillus sp. GP183]|uniref:NUDIX hydrolase n=1 Tax=Paenibacillus sp. GP183 TaxID=1882751 RepID=UPI000898DD03|nr:NUDIX domain-containing protein [Paenibacillus sp. GP183]SEC12441.1 ADP-ribose pyrophosphatase YjhB, NUDIX family [Paenibacillus sp. GP183]
MGYIHDIRKLVGTRPIIFTGVVVVVFNGKNEVLFQMRTDTKDWGIIGGALELGESLEEAAHRELYEEAGIMVNELNFNTLLSGNDMYYKYPHGDEVYNVISVYETKKFIGEPHINDDEGTELKFFSLAEPIENMKCHKRFLKNQVIYCGDK